MSDQRKTRGKQKIEMKMIAKEEDRGTAFSKRKSGIYKKANELATLCGAEINFMTFSPTGNPFSFAQRSMESIENRLIDIDNPPPRFDPSTNISDDQPLIRAHKLSKLEGLNQYYSELASILEGEKAKRKAIDKLMENSAAKNESGKGWWETSVDNLGYEELLQMNESLEDIHEKLCNHINGDRRTNNNTNAFRNSGKNPI